MNQPDYVQRLSDLQRSLYVGDNAVPFVPPAFVDVRKWQDQPVPAQEWGVPGRVPRRNVTLLSGEGGVGKTLTLVHLSVAVERGKEWLGATPTQGPVLLLLCEDDADELHRRLNTVLNHYNADFTDLSNFHPITLAGEEALLAVFDRRGVIQPTPLFKHLHEQACDLRPCFIGIDNSADVFGGNENDRAQVRQFITLLRGTAIAANASLLLTSHPSLTGINTGTGLSGSTAWHASVRARIYFKRPLTEKGEEPDKGLRLMEVMKSNYGPAGETLELRWRDGLFLPIAKPGTLEKIAAEQNAEHLFLNLLQRFTDQGRAVSDKPTSNNYAVKVFTAESEAKQAHLRRRDLETAMARLFAAKKIAVENYGRPSRPYTRLVKIEKAA